MEKKITQEGNSYWNNNGAYTKELEKIWKELVPNSGEAKTLHGELVRVSGRLNYECFNNGNGNSVEAVLEECSSCDGLGWENNDDDSDEDCSWCGGDCQIESGEYEITDMWNEFVDFLKQHMEEKKPIIAVVNFLEEGGDCHRKDAFKIYNDLLDAVGHQVMTTENKTL